MDVEDKDKALRICRQAKASVDAIKVGYPLILKEGISVLEDIKKLGKPIIADLKVADIPEVSARICSLAGAADYVIVHGFVGEDVMRACSEVARIFVVAEMSHPGAKKFMARCSAEIAAMARKYAQGIVAPATRPASIRKLRKVVGGLTIISPGVKAQGARPGDAIRAGADYEIVGRGIYQARDPRKAAEDFARAARKATAK